MTGPKGGYYEAELGEPHKFDPTFRGPVHNRGCTDVLCCVIFVIVILGYIVLGTVAWMHGDPRKVVYPTDSYGQFCGQQGTPNANKAILFYFNILQCANPTVLINLQCPTTQLCVSKCPDRFATYIDMQYNYRRNKSYWDYYKLFCKPGFNNPDKEVGVKIFEDYASSWFWILIGLVISMLVSLIFILLLRFTAGVLFWMVIFGVIAAMGYGIWHCYWEYSSLKGKPDSDITISDIGFQTDFRVYLQLRQTWLMFMISLAVIEAIIILVLIFLRNRVRIAIALLKEGSKAIGCIMSTLFYPIITFLLLALCIAYWAVTAVSLYYILNIKSSNCHIGDSFRLFDVFQTFSQSNVTKLCPGSQCTFAFYGGESLYHRYIFVLQLCNLLVFLWLVNFTIALGQCTLAGAFASYYWALRKPADIPPCPLASSFGRALRYHTGSLAFGALILSIVQFIRIILEYLDHKLKGAHNAFTRFLLCCLKCCFWCLEHFIKFMNRNAYIMISIYGKNFCASARDAFFLFMRNVMRVAVLDKVTDFLLFLGKLLISGSVGVLAFFFFTRQIPVIQEEVPSLNYYWVPLLTVIFGSYMIAHGFFNVYAMCVDTLFLCFLLDLEKNDGSATRPYYMGSSLRAILNKKNKRPEEKKKRRKHKKEQPNKRH
uniref:Choline transporter-like protein n=1 Tax=Sinocyclocheilus anshuiensis TaxID=1608454 RepID=A0A671Q953_9TELE